MTTLDTRTLSIAWVQAAATLAGHIVAILAWHEGLTYWETVWDEVYGLTPLQVPQNQGLYLLVYWLNEPQSTWYLTGHVDLTVTKPDGTRVTPAVYSGQDQAADPGNGYGVVFDQVTMDQVGNYQAEIVLSSV